MKVQHGIVSEIVSEIIDRISCFSKWDWNESVKVEMKVKVGAAVQIKCIGGQCNALQGIMI